MERGDIAGNSVEPRIFLTKPVARTESGDFSAERDCRAREDCKYRRPSTCEGEGVRTVARAIDLLSLAAIAPCFEGSCFATDVVAGPIVSWVRASSVVYGNKVPDVLTQDGSGGCGLRQCQVVEKSRGLTHGRN